jgi:hypothetical protein
MPRAVANASPAEVGALLGLATVASALQIHVQPVCGGRDRP